MIYVLVEHKHLLYISLEMCMRLELKHWLLGEGHHLARGCLVWLLLSVFGKQRQRVCPSQEPLQFFIFVINAEKGQANLGALRWKNCQML